MSALRAIIFFPKKKMKRAVCACLRFASAICIFSDKNLFLGEKIKKRNENPKRSI